MTPATQVEPLLPSEWNPAVSETNVSSLRKPAMYSSLPAKRYDMLACRRSWILHMAGLLTLNICLKAAFLVSLYCFARLDHLSTWPKRAFNTVAIIQTALLSLGIGHLISELGKAIRWKLLTSWPHHPIEVEYVLNIHSPSAFWKWLGLHFKSRPKKVFSRKTGVCLGGFLFCNFLGRISVAMYGLAFNLEDSIEWTSALYATNMSAEWEVYTHPDMNSEFIYSAANLGLKKWGLENTSDHVFSPLQLSNLTFDIDPVRGITYSYIYPGYDSSGLPSRSRSSNRTVRVNTKCDQFEVIDLDNGTGRKRCPWDQPFCETIGNSPPKPAGKLATWTLRDKDNNEKEKIVFDYMLEGTQWDNVTEGVIHDLTSYAASYHPRWVSNSIYYNLSSEPKTAWSDEDLRSPCTTYRDHEFCGCTWQDTWRACRELYFWLGGQYHSESKIPSADDIGFWECQYSITEGTMHVQSDSNNNHTYGHTLGLTEKQKGQLIEAWAFEKGAWVNNMHSRWKSLQKPPFMGIETAGNIKNNRTAAELLVAGSLARATIAALAYIDNSAINDARIELSKEVTDLKVRLSVLWRRVWLITILLYAGQVILVVCGFMWCRNVMIRDDHVFSHGKFVERLLGSIGGGTTERGENIAREIPFEVLYGTVEAEDGVKEAYLWKSDEVNAVFSDGYLYS